MLVRGLWICTPRFGKRGIRLLRMICALTGAVAVFSLLFVDVVESWITSIGMSMSPVPEPHSGLFPQQSAPPIKPEDFLLMPSSLVCQRAKPYLITMVTSAPAHHKARQAIRSTWGGETVVRGLKVLTLFMLGVPSDHALSRLLIEEAKEKGDLVQGRFLDTYSNLTLKTLALQRWVNRFCPQAHFLAKVDDDIMFNPSALLTLLNKSHTYEQSDLYLGRVHLHVAPNRDPDSKHYVPTSVYKSSVFPDYCSGTAYVLSRHALLKISSVASVSPLARAQPPEDIFVGVCAHAAGIKPTHSPLFSGGPSVPYGRCCYQAMVSVHHIAPAEMLDYWSDSQSSGQCIWLSMKVSLCMCKVGALLSTAFGLGKE
ncbi:beta-1,3-galactosyltransferase 5 [Corythoichthys intestinalis]|uniref:beta-1,3-galactosyltransferase 5 n=1 Tax=Corythoichthys intestinalis TaxID=161448 RepID=UPI0025A60A36|nr:beta-1,3-galactosyltransferase 5 [Corythoichthys intestinalis]XP_061802373.1 beta-1,3-galactosyltransferase 5-like [Nerophis lumbriciformis]